MVWEKTMRSGSVYGVATALAVGILLVTGQARTLEAAGGFWDQVYQKNHVVEIDLSLTRDAWQRMQPRREARRPGERAPRVGFGDQFSYVKADVQIDGHAYPSSGVRFKGNSSFRFSERGLKRPLKIDTNRFVKGQKLHGRTKINLSNAFLDSAYMKEKLGYEVYRAAGLVTPGVGWAHVTLSIDGDAEVQKRDLGIYVLIEQVDAKFLQRNLGKDAAGSLLMKPEALDDWEYLGNDTREYRHYNIKSGENNRSQLTAFAALLNIIETAPADRFEAEIGQRVDLQQFAGYLAATWILVNIDSYVGMPHNYYLLLDKTDGKLRMLPWDLNETFGTFTMDYAPEQLVQWGIERPWVGRRRLMERLFEMRSFRRAFQGAVVALMESVFTRERMFARISEMERTLLPYMEGRQQAAFRMGIYGDRDGINVAVDRRVYAIRPFVERRIDSVRDQLTGARPGKRLSRRR